MTIREIIDGYDREIQRHKAGILSLQGMRARVLATCRGEEAKKADSPADDTGDDAVCLKLPDAGGGSRKRKAA